MASAFPWVGAGPPSAQEEEGRAPARGLLPPGLGSLLQKARRLPPCPSGPPAAAAGPVPAEVVVGEELPLAVGLAAAPAVVESEVAPACAASPFGEPRGRQLLIQPRCALWRRARLHGIPRGTVYPAWAT